VNNPVNEIFNNAIYRIRYRDVVRDGTMVNLDTLSQLFGLRLAREDHCNLLKLVSAAKTRYGNNSGSSKTYENFWGSFKKGSKSVRKILDPYRKTELSHNMVKFASNTDTIIGLEDASFMNKFWDEYYLSNTFSTFLF
jgi:hypothetical protein